MDDCIFCRIVNQEIPCMKIYEDTHTLVFLDIAEDVDGHMLAVPKKHVKNLLDCDADTLRHLMDIVKKIAVYCVENCGYEGVNLLNASGESAGQSVSHFHIHIIPRKENDGIDAWPSFKGSQKPLYELHRILAMNARQKTRREE